MSDRDTPTVLVVTGRTASAVRPDDLREHGVRVTVEGPDLASDRFTDGFDDAAPDCVCLTHGPSADGLALLSGLRERFPTLPVVLVLASDRDRGMAVAAEDEATDFVVADRATPAELAARCRHAVTVCRSATERREAELERRVREERTLKNRIVETVPVGIVLLDRDGRITFANEYASEWMDLGDPDPETGVYDGFDWQECYPDGSPIPEEELIYRRVIDTGEPATEPECLLRWPDGRERYYSAYGAPLTESGPVETVVFAFRDITDDVERERDLQFVRELVEKVGVGVVAYTESGRIDFANPAFADLLNTGVDAVTGQPLWTFVDGIDEADFESFWNSFTRGETRRAEGVYVRPDETTLLVETVTTRIDVGGRTYHVGTVENVSERREREERLNVLNRVLRHNLRNELNVILGCAETMKRDTDSEQLERTTRAANRLLSLSEKAQTMERALAREIDPDAVVDLTDVVEHEVSRLRREYPQAAITYDAPERAHAHGDDTFATALTELLDNAVEHNDSPPADCRVAVSVRVPAEGEFVEVEVADDGPGIPPEERNVLTNAYEITPLYHGSGLGLWVVNWIVRRFDGEFRIESSESEGTSVTVLLRKAYTEATGVPERARRPPSK